MLRIGPNTKAADLIIAHPGAILIFERLGLPLKLQDKTLEQVAEQHELNPALLINLLHLALYRKPKDIGDLQPHDAMVIIEYLLRSHEYYRLEVAPRIAQLIQTLRAELDSNGMPLLEQFFEAYIQEVDDHFDYEDQTAFPYIQQLFNHPTHPQLSEYTIEHYTQHHSDLQEKLDDLQELLIRYLPVPKTSSTLRQLILAVTDFGNDMLNHTAIENEILVPLVQKEERKCTS
ncbi:MAG: hypothetical protein CSA97_04335 [Bacteroidetes bacterium]|nr:MAG: hypothetical protein CSA97_04335 [Bacteroidota bacterium]